MGDDELAAIRARRMQEMMAGGGGGGGGGGSGQMGGGLAMPAGGGGGGGGGGEVKFEGRESSVVSHFQPLLNLTFPPANLTRHKLLRMPRRRGECKRERERCGVSE